MKTYYVKIKSLLTKSYLVGGALVGPDKDCIVELNLCSPTKKGQTHVVCIDLTPIDIEMLIEDLKSELYAIQDLKRKKYSK